MIYIIDFGAGNLQSAYHALAQSSTSLTVVDKAIDIKKDCRGLVLPGDGSFRYAMEELSARGFTSYLREHREVPLLGICVGFQLLFEYSEEDGGSEGLGLVQGQCLKLPAVGDPVPHIGWNQTQVLKSDPLTTELKQNSWFYYVHSYYVQYQNQDFASLMTDYAGEQILAGIHYKNIFAYQFHPEKSHLAGRRMIELFVQECLPNVS